MSPSNAAYTIVQHNIMYSHAFLTCPECGSEVETFGTVHDQHVWDRENEICAKCSDRAERDQRDHLRLLNSL